MTTIESAVIPSMTLKVDATDYIVVFPLSAVVQAEEKIGKPLKSLQDWFGLSTKDIPAVLAAGLEKHQPGLSADVVTAICDRLNPESLDEVQYALCKLAFPRRMAALDSMPKGKASPNVPSGDAL